MSKWWASGWMICVCSGQSITVADLIIVQLDFLPVFIILEQNLKDNSTFATKKENTSQHLPCSHVCQLTTSYTAPEAVWENNARNGERCLVNMITWPSGSLRACPGKNDVILIGHRGYVTMLTKKTLTTAGINSDTQLPGRWTKWEMYRLINRPIWALVSLLNGN